MSREAATTPAPEPEGAGSAGPCASEIWLAILLLALPALAYANSIWGDFFYDGTAFVERDAGLEDLGRVSRDLSAPRYFSRVLFALNRSISGVEPWSYHVVNLAIHLLNTWLAFDLIRVTLSRLRPAAVDATALAFGAALLWSCHPLQTQAVTYLYQRSEVLASTFYLGALLAFARSQPAGRSWLMLVSLLCVAAGFRTKLIIASAPFAVLLFDLIIQRSTWREIVTRRWAYYGSYLLLVVVAGVALLARSQGLASVGIGSGEGVPSPWAYLINQPTVILRYVQLWFFPSGQLVLYDWPPAASAARLAGPILLVGGLLMQTAAWLWRRSPWGFVSAWFFLILAPTSSLVPIRHLIFEHRAYLPSLALSLVTVWAARAMADAWLRGARSQRVWLSAIVVASLVMAVVTHNRNRVYYDRVDMWWDHVRKQPDHSQSHTNLVSELIRRRRFEEAAGPAARAVELDSTDAVALNNHGIVLLQLGRTDEAKACFEQCLVSAPSASLYVNLANLERRSDPSQAVAYLRAAIDLDPKHSEAHNNLAALLKRSGADRAEVERLYRLAIRHDPRNTAPKKNLAILLAEQGRLDDAIALLRDVLNQTPHDPQARNNLKVLLANRTASP